MASVTDQLASKRDELRSKIDEIKEQHDESTERLSKEQREEWNRLNDELEEVEENLREREAMTARVAELASSGKAERGATFNIRKSQTENIYDLSTVERSYGDPSVEGRNLKDRAKRVLEAADIPHPEAERANAKSHVDKMLARDSEDGRFAQYIVATDSPAYKRAFVKLMQPAGVSMLTREEQAALAQAKHAERALSLTGASGGFAVPFVLDPTVIPTSNLAVNPWRGIARIENITVDEWRGVSSAGVTAAYAAEGTATSDNAPTLAQPTVSTEKAQAFIPFSIEVGMDWNSLQVEMGRLLQDAKDELEATMFTTGSGTNQPQGVITGATATVTASTGGTFVSKDIFTVEENLPPRFRPRASFAMNRAIANRIRQFDTAGGASLWVDNLQLGLVNGVPTPGNLGARLIGYGAYESSAMSSSVTTGQKILIAGDFSYYLIADRIGLNVELIPHLVDTTNNRPTGQRGLYAYWRNGAGVLSTNAFRVLQL